MILDVFSKRSDSVIMQKVIGSITETPRQITRQNGRELFLLIPQSFELLTVFTLSQRIIIMHMLLSSTYSETEKLSQGSSYGKARSEKFSCDGTVTSRQLNTEFPRCIPSKNYVFRIKPIPLYLHSLQSRQKASKNWNPLLFVAYD